MDNLNEKTGLEQEAIDTSLANIQDDKSPEQAPGLIQLGIDLFNKYKWLMPYFSFATGVVSALLMKRGFDRMYWLLGALFLTWTVVGLVPLLQDRAEHSERGIFKGLHFGSVVLAQSAAQEVLFFILPFYYWSCSLRSANLIFFLLLLLVILATLIDPVFEFIAKIGPASMALLGFANFATLNFALPVVIGLPNTLSLHLSVLLTALLLTLYAGYSKSPSIPADPSRSSAPEDVQEQKTASTNSEKQVQWIMLRGRLVNALFVSLGLMLAIWLFDLQRIIPPAPLRIAKGVACRHVVNKEPVEISDTFVVNKKPDPIYCYTAIQAPRGLHDEIEHRWFHDGRLINTVELKGISGGRTAGYRTWSVKRNFPKNPFGDWRCEARTKAGQLVGEIRFELTKKIVAN